MKQRVITALLVTPMAIALILLAPSAWLGGVIAGLCLLARWEWTRMAGMRSRPLRAVLVALCGVALLALWFEADDTLGWVAIVAGCVWWCFAVLWLKHFSFGAAPTRENVALKLMSGALAMLDSSDPQPRLFTSEFHRGATTAPPRSLRQKRKLTNGSATRVWTATSILSMRRCTST